MITAYSGTIQGLSICLWLIGTNPLKKATGATSNAFKYSTDGKLLITETLEDMMSEF